MKYLIIGDTHGELDLDKVTPEILALLSPQDAIIHCGDIGLAWLGQPNDPSTKFWRSLDQMVYICLGNHENYDWIKRQPIRTRGGARGYQLAPNLFAPLLGEILELGGKRFWFYPGGYSVDYLYRTPRRTIWKEEMPCIEASKRAIQKLKAQAPVDYVISHDGPRSFIVRRWNYPIEGPKPTYYSLLQIAEDSVIHPAFALDEVYHHPAWWRRWFFGHHHMDDDDQNIRPIFNDLILIDGDCELVL